MSMTGLDISPWQQSLNLLNITYDFVLIKATEGTTYVSPTCDTHYQEAKQMNKKRAVYMFTDFLDPVMEANYFVDNCTGYIRDAIFVLDWEGTGVSDVQGALKRLQQIEARIGYKPAIYMSEWVENNYDWSPVVQNNNGLIIAKYSNWELANNADNYDMSNAGQSPIIKHWPFYFMWQWTSTGRLNGYAGDLDCDIAYLTPDQWDKYAGVQPTPAVVSAPLSTPATPTVQPVPTPTPSSTTTTPATIQSTTIVPPSKAPSGQVIDVVKPTPQTTTITITDPISPKPTVVTTPAPTLKDNTVDILIRSVKTWVAAMVAIAGAGGLDITHLSAPNNAKVGGLAAAATAVLNVGIKVYQVLRG
jgi:GH25 family lysozyme M1 (1,4-beta-N-acetylmuramidase)